MILKNLLLILPTGLISSMLKTLRTNLNEQTAKYIEENGMYHFTKDLDTANKIIESGKINPSKNAIVSYGVPAAFLFAGIQVLIIILKIFLKEHGIIYYCIRPNIVCS